MIPITNSSKKLPLISLTQFQSTSAEENLFRKAAALSKEYSLYNRSDSPTKLNFNQKTRNNEDLISAEDNDNDNLNFANPKVSCRYPIFSSPRSAERQLTENHKLHKQNAKLNEIISVRKYFKILDAEEERARKIEKMSKTKMTIMTKDAYKLEVIAKDFALKEQKYEKEETIAEEKARIRSLLTQGLTNLKANFIFPNFNSPQSRLGTSFSLVNDKVIMIGGLSGRKFNDVWELSSRFFLSRLV